MRRKPPMSDKRFIKALRATSDGSAIKLPTDTPAYNEREHELIVDHTLGSDFDVDRRRVLRQVHLSLQQQRQVLLEELTENRIDPRKYVHELQAATTSAVARLQTILSPAELEAFLGVTAAEEASLPVDFQQIRQ